MKNNKFIILLSLSILILFFSFYWFEYRPYIVRKECYSFSKEKYQDKDNFAKDDYEKSVITYDLCLHRYGLKE